VVATDAPRTRTIAKGGFAMLRSAMFIRRLLTGATLALGVLAAALDGSTAGADTPPERGAPLNLPTISALKVQAGGTEATVTFTTAQPAYVTVEHKPATTAVGRQPAVQVLDGVFQAVTTPTPNTPVKIFDGIGTLHRSYTTTHERKLAGLKSNTTYDVVVTAETQSGQKHTATTRVTTLKQRVRVTLREIKIERDGDTVGDGEPSWLVGLTWAGGEILGCYPNNGAFCETGSHGDGQISPRNYLGKPLMWLFAEENFDTMPDSFNLFATAEEYDLIDIIPFCCGFTPPRPAPQRPDWTVPQDKEFASQPFTTRANHSSSGQDFKSVLTFTFELFHDNLSYPAARNAPQSTWSR
jgi:hypothetical protein